MKARDKFPSPPNPFSDGLLDYMDKDIFFYNSLKLANVSDFRFLGILFTSHTPSGHPSSTDEVIGLWYGDINNIKSNSHPHFKQDFIVNIQKQDRGFISYTIKRFVNGNSVKLINDFFRDYGDAGKFYHNGLRWQHHYKTINDLPNEPGLHDAAKNLLIKLNPNLAHIA